MCGGRELAERMLPKVVIGVRGGGEKGRKAGRGGEGGVCGVRVVMKGWRDMVEVGGEVVVGGGFWGGAGRAGRGVYGRWLMGMRWQAAGRCGSSRVFFLYATRRLDRGG